MDTRSLIAFATLAVAASAASADDITMATETAASTKTRAEVASEVLKACADGTLLTGGEVLLMRAPAMASPSTVSREAVRARLADRAAMVAASAVEAP